MPDLQYTGYTTKTPSRYWIDAGAVYLNLVVDPATGAYVSGELIGATKGGNEFTINLTTRTSEVDGLKGKGKGNTIITSEEPRLKINLKELTAKNLALAIPGSKVDITTNKFYDIITSKGKIELTDYLDNVALVGRETGTNRPIIVIVENVISLEGLQIKTEDNNEVVIPITLDGHYGENNVTLGEAPYKIYWPKPTGAISGIVKEGTALVVGATVKVTIGTKDLTTTTDANGAYILEDIPVGTYTVTATLDAKTGNAANVVVAEDTITEDKDITIV